MVSESYKELKTGDVFKSYRDLCNRLGEKITSSRGKMYQLKDWERYFSWHKSGNKMIIDLVYDIPKEKIDNRKFNKGGNNCKNIRPMIDYLLACDIELEEYYSMTSMYCNVLGLLNTDACNIVYSNRNMFIKYCECNGISDIGLFGQYVYEAKRVLKQVLMTALDYMQKHNMIDFMCTKHFVYRVGKRSKGHFYTNSLNSQIEEFENMACDKINGKYKFSKSAKGRQALVYIYSDSEYKDIYDTMKCDMLMSCEKSLAVMNECIKGLSNGFYAKKISVENPLLNYYNVITISSMIEKTDITQEELTNLKKEIISIVTQKVEKSMKSFNCSELKLINSLLFKI